MRIALILLLFGLASGLMAQGPSCKRLPPFIKNLGFAPDHSALISTERRTRGVVLVEYKDVRNPSAGVAKRHQDETWKSAGFVSSITLGPYGDAYVLPSAMVNTIHNPAMGQNTIHRIRGVDGKMEVFVELPMEQIPNDENAFGLMGAFLDCADHSLVVSSIAGSTREKERGVVYKVDLKTRDYVKLMEGEDVFGVAVVHRNGRAYLIYGKARNSEIWEADITEGRATAHRKVIDLSNLGPRGDDKARRIKFDQGGRLVIQGTPFYYNLTAPSVRQETQYVYMARANGEYQLVGIQ